MQQWVSECYARHVQAGAHLAFSAAAMADEGSVAHLTDLTAIILDVKQQLKTITDKVNNKGFTPRADKGKIGHGGGGSVVRFAAKDLHACRGELVAHTHAWKRVAFHNKGSGAFIPFCANDANAGSTTCDIGAVTARTAGRAP
ncbi:hypothetical protein CYMTET_45400 [Cymbomonas tetramitiformis]|uniref:Uncharacterized protein n=1 Tax=Cymbomonas tetramitiformis TaxID=36881 RepID=A0AAE0BYA5_9CHLO|nr:hypothetical protein CYMTET_45400 [Cymbomonas tetramitiformis]